MKISAVKSHGKKRWQLDARSIGGGRLFFTSWEKADQQRQALIDSRKSFAAAWLNMSTEKRDELIAVAVEIEAAGLSPRHVWEKFKAGGNALKSRSLALAIEELIEAKAISGRRAGYIRGLENYLKAFGRGREGMEVSQIKPADIEQWFVDRAEPAQSQLSSMGRLSALFQFCWRLGYIAENPVKRVEKPTFNSKTPAILTNRQCARILAWTARERPDLLAWLVLALFVGLRPESEAGLISWGVIDFRRNRIWIESDATKVRRHRIIDLAQIPGATNWLLLAQKMNSTLPVCESTRCRFIVKLRTVLKFERWPQDILRHTAASNLLAHHQDAGKVAHILGNSAGTLLKRYKALIVKEDAERFYSLFPGLNRLAKWLSD